MTATKPPTSPAHQLLHLLENTIRSAELAGYSAPSLFEDAEKLAVDLLVEIRQMKADRDRQIQERARWNLWMIDIKEATLELGPAMVDEAADTLSA